MRTLSRYLFSNIKYIEKKLVFYKKILQLKKFVFLNFPPIFARPGLCQFIKLFFLEQFIFKPRFNYLLLWKPSLKFQNQLMLNWMCKRSFNRNLNGRSKEPCNYISNSWKDQEWRNSNSFFYCWWFFILWLSWTTDAQWSLFHWNQELYKLGR